MYITCNIFNTSNANNTINRNNSQNEVILLLFYYLTLKFSDTL